MKSNEINNISIKQYLAEKEHSNRSSFSFQGNDNAYKDLNEFYTHNNMQRQEQGYVFVNENPRKGRHI